MLSNQSCQYLPLLLATLLERSQSILLVSLQQSTLILCWCTINSQATCFIVSQFCNADYYHYWYFSLQLNSVRKKCISYKRRNLIVHQFFSFSYSLYKKSDLFFFFHSYLPFLDLGREPTIPFSSYYTSSLLAVK